MYIYMPHMKSFALIFQQGALYTNFTYITEQIWLSHSKYTSHVQHDICLSLSLYIYIVYILIYTTVCIYTHQNKPICYYSFTGNCKVCARNKYTHQIRHICKYAKYITYIYRGCMYIYMPHMKSLALIFQKGALCTYFTYITEQIWLSHYKYTSHGNHFKRA